MPTTTKVKKEKVKKSKASKPAKKKSTLIPEWADALVEIGKVMSDHSKAFSDLKVQVGHVASILSNTPEPDVRAEGVIVELSEPDRTRIDAFVAAAASGADMRRDLATQTVIDCVTDAVTASNLSWGPGRLLKCVKPELREKFHTQVEMYNVALGVGDYGQIKIQGEAVERALFLLGTEAQQAGHDPMSKQTVTGALPSSNRPVIICQRQEEAVKLSGACLAFSVDEICALLDQTDNAIILQVKDKLGGQVVRTNQKGDGDGSNIGDDLDDGIPF